MQDRTFDCFFFSFSFFVPFLFFSFFFVGGYGEENCLFLMKTSMLLKVRSSLQLPAWGSDSLQDSWCTAAGTSRIDQVGCTVCTYQDFGQGFGICIVSRI